MALTRRLAGRLRGDTDEREPYVCLTCRTRFEQRRHVCPDCGGFSVERAEWPQLRE